MTQDEFAAAVKQVCIDSAKLEIMRSIDAPPGPKGSPVSDDVARWVKQLNQGERSRLADLLEAVMRQSVYNFFAALDGLLAIDEGPEHGELVLLYRAGDREVRLNAPDQEQLTSVLRSYFD